jgi:hypothetical protein
MFRRRRLACSFCGKGEADVAKLVAGPKVFICDRCVAVASQIMQTDSGDEPQPPKPEMSLLQRVINRIGRVHRSWFHRSIEREEYTGAR